ncbi:alpha/beta hydrolase [Microbacterium sp. zg.B48]|uniref:alpha/beta fold hydrolase n=1 Tax=unclassified Microbacterium TaxID=2609290 RepID=UPI00214BE5CB|nr:MULTISPECIES: alpha/beta hydrolase [unclassified Microbacterium]MCR2762186.1 alpha/beta hydrolase [Microbacterium sp. zg.B48]MCR2809807.1 alpha/beta hydrolase [Microbacterium sp. zg.B185]WIM17882.1 alpha/beta hydrolase [Microbacterium sp. zg-B185]
METERDSVGEGPRDDRTGADGSARGVLTGALAKLRERRNRPSLHVALDEGTGPVVVLVHGIASSSVTFENVVPLIRSTHRVVAIDLLGFGGSPAPEGSTFTLEEHVDYLERTLRRLELRRPFVLVGHSMGALIAARYGARRSTHLSGLVLVSPPIYLPPDVVGDPIDRAAMKIYRQVYDFLRGNPAFTIRNAAFVARLSPIKNALVVDETNWTAFVLSLENSIESQTAITDIAAVDTGIQVVYGTLDPFLVPGALRIVERMRHVAVQKIDGGDHLIRKRMARVVAAAVDSLSR